MTIITNADEFVGNLVRGVGVFTLYAGLVSGIYITLNAIRAMDYKNITIYALMTGGLFYIFSIGVGLAGPLAEMELLSDDDWDEEEAEGYY